MKLTLILLSAAAAVLAVILWLPLAALALAGNALAVVGVLSIFWQDFGGHLRPRRAAISPLALAAGRS